MSKKELTGFLSEWEEQISVFPRLKIEEARSLYLQAIKISDEEEKKELLKRIVEGTLYVILYFVKNNKLDKIKNVNFGIEDIVNTCNELWVSAIYDGELLKNKDFSRIADESFCNKLASVLCETDLNVADLTFLTADSFVKVMYEYIEYQKKFGEVSIEAFYKIIYDVCGADRLNFYIHPWGRVNDVSLIDSEFLERTIMIMEYITDAIKDENDDINLTRTKIEKFKYLLIDSGMQGFRVNLDDVYESDFSEHCVDHVMIGEIMDVLLSPEFLDSRKRDILVRLFGLNGEEKQNGDEVGDVYGLTKARTLQLRDKALAMCRFNSKVKKYNNILDGR